MIIVIMTEQNKINGRQILESNAGWAHSFWTRPIKWAGAFTPNRIGKNVQSFQLDKKSGVINKRDTITGFNSGDRLFTMHAVGRWFPFCTLPRKKPFEHVGQTFRLYVARVYKLFAIEMICFFALIFWT